MTHNGSPVGRQIDGLIRVLLIEDDPALPELIEMMLVEGTRAFRFQVDHEGTLVAGINRLVSGDYDVVLLDLNLPDRRGMQSLRALRAEAPQVPVVVLTGAAEEELAVQALREGAQDYLVKAFVERRLLVHTLWSAVERNRLIEELRVLSLTDELTGLHNRRGFELLAGHQLRVAGRYGRRLLLVFVDVDGLKGVNDRWGHAEGDRALVAVADAFRNGVRASDVVARWGGDEFVLIAAESPSTANGVVVDRLMESVRACGAALEAPYRLQVSAGTGVYDPEAPCSLDDLVRRADGELYDYRRRRDGGNGTPPG